MALRHPMHGHGHEEVVAAESTAVHEPFGAAQIYNIAMGVFFVVLGAIGLARTGVDNLTRPAAEVLGMNATALLSLIHIAIGVIALACSVSRPAARSGAMVIGASLVALGIIALIEGVDALGWTAANGAAYLISGVLAIAAAIATPLVAYGRRSVATSSDHGYVA